MLLAGLCRDVVVGHHAPRYSRFGVLGLGNHGHGHGTRVAVGELRLRISCRSVQLGRTGDTRRCRQGTWIVLLRVGRVRHSGHIQL